MNATLNNETRPIIREHRGVVWCPFCDRSRQLSMDGSFCDGCRAEFTESPVEEAAPVAAPAPEEAVDLSAADVPATPRRRQAE
jgi:hypothetical protein